MGVKYTNKIVLTADWQTISDGKATCLISPSGIGRVEFAVADAAADLVPGDTGHSVNVAKNFDPILLTGLGTKDVMARTNADGIAHSVYVVVTAY